MKATVKNSRFYYGVVIKYIPVICRKEDQTMTQHFNDDIQRQIDEMDLNGPPPIEEPRRQYWFIKKCREIVKRKSEEIGRPLSACTVNMGCQMNTEHGKRKAAKTAAFSYGVVFRDEGERKRGRISPSGRTGSEVRS